MLRLLVDIVCAPVLLYSVMGTLGLIFLVIRFVGGSDKRKSSNDLLGARQGLQLARLLTWYYGLASFGPPLVKDPVGAGSLVRQIIEGFGGAEGALLSAMANNAMTQKALPPMMVPRTQEYDQVVLAVNSACRYVAERGLPPGLADQLPGF